MQATKQTTDELNGVLKGEISAVETYRQALEQIEDTSIRETLQKCQDCHSDRVISLTEQVRTMGGEPALTSGIWGTFAKMMEGGAKVFGDKACIDMLEEGEDKGLADYKKIVEDPNSAIKESVQKLFSAQQGTHAKMRDLKHSLEKN